MKRHFSPAAAFVLATALAGAQARAEAAAPMEPLHAGDRIVNGVTTSDYPSTVALLQPGSGVEFCTGTLIGCQTILTAAHCVCRGSGADCQGASADLLQPSDILIFSQHGGFANVASVSVPESYEFGMTGDVAVLGLSAPIEGIAPSPINTAEDPAPGTAGTIVGFGLSRGDRDDAGLKREGQVETTACFGVPDPPHVCWLFTDPLGNPGDDSNTCPGDSGGPLFVDFGDGPVVAGVTSGGVSEDCLPFDEAWDANVFFERQWILDRGGDDLNTACGELPSDIHPFEGNVNAANPQRTFTLEVPPEALKLRVGLNGIEGPAGTLNDFDLYVRATVPATTSSFDCASQATGNYEFCDIDTPAAGTWHVLVDRFAGNGRFQATATVFGGTAPPNGACVSSATTLCIDDVPGDRRFKIEVAFSTAIGNGSNGDGKAIPLAPLGIRRGGLFWFFDITNPELLIKVLNGCEINGFYWVFWSAGTTVALELRVTDTLTGRTVVYFNTDGHPADPVTDTAAFSCATTAAGDPSPAPWL